MKTRLYVLAMVLAMAAIEAFGQISFQQVQVQGFAPTGTCPTTSLVVKVPFGTSAGLYWCKPTTSSSTTGSWTLFSTSAVTLPANLGVVATDSSGNAEASNSTKVQTVIGAGVYDASGAAAARAGVGSACGTHQFEHQDTTTGPACAQPSAADLSAGALPTGTTIADPSAATQVANKEYVDGHSGGSSTPFIVAPFEIGNGGTVAGVIVGETEVVIILNNNSNVPTSSLGNVFTLQYTDPSSSNFRLFTAPVTVAGDDVLTNGCCSMRGFVAASVNLTTPFDAASLVLYTATGISTLDTITSSIVTGFANDLVVQFSTINSGGTDLFVPAPGFSVFYNISGSGGFVLSTVTPPAPTTINNISWASTAQFNDSGPVGFIALRK